MPGSASCNLFGHVDIDFVGHPAQAASFLEVGSLEAAIHLEKLLEQAALLGIYAKVSAAVGKSDAQI